MKAKINMKDIKSKSKEQLEKIVWELWVSYAVNTQDTDDLQYYTFKNRFNKIEKTETHFTDIDYQKCRLVDGKLYI